MNGNNYNSHSSPYHAQSYNDEYSHDSVEAYDDDIHQEYSQNSGQMGYQMGNTFEYQPEHMYDFNDIGEYQSDYQIDAIQEYSQLESQGYLNNKQMTSGNANITGRQNDPNNREYPQIENRGYTNNNQFNNGNTTGIRQNEAIQEYSQIDNQGYPNNNQYNNGNTNINQFNNANTNTNQYHPNTNIGGMQQNSNMPGSGRNTQAYNSTIAKVYQSQHSNSPLHDPNSFTASSESSFASQPSPKEQLQYLRDPQQQETSQVNGILQMEGSVEPNGPILGGQGYIPAQTVQKAYYELGETPEIKSACLRGFRQQIEIHQEENNFDEHSDAFLLKFLRSRKFDVESAYALLEKYYNVRENKPEVFRNLTRKNVKRTMEQGIVGVLPQRDKKGRAIVIFNFHGWNMSLAFHFEKLLRVFVFTLEKLFESEETQINGMVIISNLAQLSVLQTKNLGATMITKILEIFEVSDYYSYFPTE